MTEAKHEGHRLVLKGADDNRLVADAWGAPSAAPVIFLHGGGQTRHAWGGAAARVAAAGWYAVSVDLRGHGESDWTGRYHYWDFAADATCLARQIGLPPVFVGASLGGISALLSQSNSDGDLCRALVLVDIAPRANPSGVDRILHFMESAADGFVSLEAAAEAVAGYVQERKRPSDVNGLRKNLRQRADGRWYWHWDPRFIETARGQSGKSSGQLEEAARRLSIPTLLVRGSESDVLTDDGVGAFRQAVPHAYFIDLPERVTWWRAIATTASRRPYCRFSRTLMLLFDYFSSGISDKASAHRSLN